MTAADGGLFPEASLTLSRGEPDSPKTLTGSGVRHRSSPRVSNRPRTLVTDEVFNAARELLGSRAHKPATHKPHRTRHPYVLKSLIYCSVCQRRMQGQHSHGVATTGAATPPTTPWPTVSITPRT
ncbi:hypothetical protein GCM10029963_75610 [Micromonospora andamanensis]